MYTIQFKTKIFLWYLDPTTFKKTPVSRNPGGGFKGDPAGRIIILFIDIFLLTPSPQSQTSSILTQPYPSPSIHPYMASYMRLKFAIYKLVK